MILISVRFMQIGRARESWQIHKARNQLKFNSDFIYKQEYTINNFDYQLYNVK